MNYVYTEQWHVLKTILCIDSMLLAPVIISPQFIVTDGRKYLYIGPFSKWLPTYCLILFVVLNSVCFPLPGILLSRNSASKLDGRHRFFPFLSNGYLPAEVV